MQSKILMLFFVTSGLHTQTSTLFFYGASIRSSLFTLIRSVHTHAYIYNIYTFIRCIYINFPKNMNSFTYWFAINIDWINIDWVNNSSGIIFQTNGLLTNNLGDSFHMKMENKSPVYLSFTFWTYFNLVCGINKSIITFFLRIVHCFPYAVIEVLCLL